MAAPSLPAIPGPWIALGLLAVTVGVGAALGLPLGLLATAGLVLVGVILLVWSSVLSLTGGTPLTLDEAVGLGAPSVEEERKQAVLRALKDLEYERGVGKISDEDFRELSARYRTEAKQLLRALDRDLAPYRELALRRIEDRLGVRGDGDHATGDGATAISEAPDREEDASDGDAGRGNGETPAGRAPAATGSERLVPAPTKPCEACGVANDADARFCKGCGLPLAQEGA